MTETETEEQSLNRTTASPLELEGQTQKPKKPFYKRTCFGVTTAIILLLVITLIILIFTVFKARDPTIKVASTTVTGVAPRVTLPAVQIELNLTIDVELRVHNPNYVSFKHGRGYSQVFFVGDQVGDVDVAPGNIGSRGSETMKARLTLEADKFNMSSLVRDVMGGMLSLELRTRVPGRAKILGFIRIHVTALSTCQVDIQLPSLNVSRQECKNKAKL